MQKIQIHRITIKYHGLKFFEKINNNYKMTMVIISYQAKIIPII